jgi:hypothetical protein
MAQNICFLAALNHARNQLKYVKSFTQGQLLNFIQSLFKIKSKNSSTTLPYKSNVQYEQGSRKTSKQKNDRT